MIVALIVFPVIFVLVLLCVGLGMAFFETKRKTQVRQMLWTANPEAPAATAELVRSGSVASGFSERLSDFVVTKKLELLLHRSLIGWTPSRFVFTCLGCGIAAALAGWQLGLLSSSPIGAAALSCAALIAPLFVVQRKRAKSLAAFEEQFPEALDFLSRSMRAGHGFSISLELLAKDASEPMATALRRVCHEMQMGATLNVALDKMVLQFPLVDVRFFVSSVLLQQETGGNLSEILMKLSSVVRERFRLRGQVKSLSAHGRITGMVLLFMPVAVVLALLAMSPEYLATLTKDKDGRLMIYGAIAGQIVAYFVIRKIVNIKV